jgi:hypothetical protein
MNNELTFFISYTISWYRLLLFLTIKRSSLIQIHNHINFRCSALTGLTTKIKFELKTAWAKHSSLLYFLGLKRFIGLVLSFAKGRQ